MRCIYCGHIDSKVIDSRDIIDGNSIKRRRQCLECSRKFTTYETVEVTSMLVVKNSGTRQPFNSSKIKKGIVKACEKTKVTISTINLIVANIEKIVANMGENEISTQKIADLVLQELKKIDDIAYIRYASVHNQFTDTDTFINFIKDYINQK